MIRFADAQELLYAYVSSESLRRHCFAVSYSMREYAKHFHEDEELWAIAGLLHDFDYEQFPENHPYNGIEILKEKKYPEEIIDAILGHVESTGISRVSLMAKTLFAVDELSGFTVALSRVRPDKFVGMTSESIEKALLKKSFAQNVNREEISKGILELGISHSEHFARVIDALKKNFANNPSITF